MPDKRAPRFIAAYYSPVALGLLFGREAFPLGLLEGGKLRLDQVSLLLEVARSTLVEGVIAIVDALLAGTKAL